MCDQQSLRSACAYAQSNQSLCLLLEYSMIVKLLTEHQLDFFSLKGGCTGSSESTFVKIPHCCKSRFAAHLYLYNSVDPGEIQHYAALCCILSGYLRCAKYLFIRVSCIQRVNKCNDETKCCVMGLAARKPVFGVSDKASFKPGSSAT